MAEAVRRAASPFRAETLHGAVVRWGEVVSVQERPSGLLRVTLTGEGMDDVVSLGFDDVIILCFPDPDTGHLALPIATPAGGLERPADGALHIREYTVRVVDSDAHTIGIDFAQHPQGLAIDWVRAAQPGDQIAYVGPRLSRGVPAADHLVLIGDDAAIAAMSRLVNDDPGHLRALHRGGIDVVLEGVEGRSMAEFASTPGLRIHQSLETVAFDPTVAFVWIAGEAAAVARWRRKVIEVGVSKDRVQFTGYWRVGQAGLE